MLGRADLVDRLFAAALLLACAIGIVITFTDCTRHAQ